MYSYRFNNPGGEIISVLRKLLSLPHYDDNFIRGNLELKIENILMKLFLKLKKKA